jgi:hypothetical protein
LSRYSVTDPPREPDVSATWFAQRDFEIALRLPDWSPRGRSAYENIFVPAL